MTKMTSLKDLWMDELADLLSAENQMIEFLPQMAQSSNTKELKGLLEGHLKETQEQSKRLEDIFSITGQNPHDLKCLAIKGLIVEAQHVIKNTEKIAERDTALINIAQRMKHYEITSYSTARQHAADLGYAKIIELFDKTLNEERLIHLRLSELAQGMINANAIASKGDEKAPEKKTGQGFYIPQGMFRKGIKKKPKNDDISRYLDEGNPNDQEKPGNAQ